MHSDMRKPFAYSCVAWPCNLPSSGLLLPYLLAFNLSCPFLPRHRALALRCAESTRRGSLIWLPKKSGVWLNNNNWKLSTWILSLEGLRVEWYGHESDLLSCCVSTLRLSSRVIRLESRNQLFFFLLFLGKWSLQKNICAYSTFYFTMYVAG